MEIFFSKEMDLGDGVVIKWHKYEKNDNFIDISLSLSFPFSFRVLKRY